MSRKGSIVMVAGAWLAMSGAVAEARDVPDYTRIRSLSHAGSGCPAGTVASNISPDQQAFTLLFDSYFAEIGAGVPVREKRKNCQLLIDFDYPTGWQFGILQIDYRGYASLEAGVTGQQKSAHYFQGQSFTMTRETPFVGPHDNDFYIQDVVPTSAVLWSPCGLQRALNINSQVRLDNSAAPGAHGLITTDSIDGSLITFVYHVAWRRCR